MNETVTQLLKWLAIGPVQKEPQNLIAEVNPNTKKRVDGVLRRMVRGEGKDYILWDVGITSPFVGTSTVTFET
jgi:hypothetical protein